MQALGASLCRAALNVLVQSAEALITGFGHHLPRVKHRAIAFRVGTNVARPTTQGRLPTVVIILARSGSKDFESFPRAQGAAAPGTKSLQGPISVTKPHGQKITSFRYRRVVPMTFPISNHCAINVNFERMLVPNFALNQIFAKSLIGRLAPRWSNLKELRGTSQELKKSMMVFFYHQITTKRPTMMM